MTKSLNLQGMYAVVGQALSAFHTVESGLASCYGFAVAPPGKCWDRAVASFFAADMFRSKLAMANTSIGLLLRNTPELAEWANLHNRADKCADTRNKLAHGAVHMTQGAKGRTIVLAGHIWDVRWTLKPTASMVSLDVV